MNKWIGVGRLTHDPETRYSTGEKSIAITRYTLAVDRRGKKKDGEQTADFIPCVAFDKSGEFAGKYFHKGTKVLVSGRIQTGSYTTKDGNKVYTTEVIVEEQEFAESKGAQPQNAAEGVQKTADEGFMSIPDGVEDEGLPFN